MLEVSNEKKKCIVFLSAIRPCANNSFANVRTTRYFVSCISTKSLERDSERDAAGGPLPNLRRPWGHRRSQRPWTRRGIPEEARTSASRACRQSADVPEQAGTCPVAAKPFLSLGGLRDAQQPPVKITGKRLVTPEPKLRCFLVTAAHAENAAAATRYNPGPITMDPGVRDAPNRKPALHHAEKQERRKKWLPLGVGWRTLATIAFCVLSMRTSAPLHQTPHRAWSLILVKVVNVRARNTRLLSGRGVTARAQSTVSPTYR